MNRLFRRVSKRTCAIFFAMAFFFSTVAVGLSTVGASVKAAGETKQVLKSLFGTAYQYGIVAERYTLSADCQSNFAVQHLVSKNHWIGSDLSTNAQGVKTPGTMYFEKLDGDLYIKSNGVNNIVLDDSFNQVSNQWVEIGKNKKGRIYVGNLDMNKVTIASNRGYVDVETTINTVERTFAAYATQADTTNISVSGNDMNNYVVDFTKCSDTVCVYNISLAKYNWIQNGGLKIKKKDSQIVIINIEAPNHNSEVTLKQASINGKTDSNDVNAASTVIYNLTNFTHNVHTNGVVVGTIVATKADVKAYANLIGRVISKYFENVSGEVHFISDDVNKETETTTVETTTEETTVVEEETTTVVEEETTTVVEEETTTVVEEETTTDDEDGEVEGDEEEITTPEETTVDEDGEVEADEDVHAGDNNALAIFMAISGIACAGLGVACLIKRK